MIIDLVFASGDLRIRTRSTPAVRHAVDLARAVLALGSDGHLTVRKQGKRLPAIEADGHYTTADAIDEILRFTTNFGTEKGLAMLIRCVRRGATLKPRDRAAIIRRIAPTLTIDYED